ncbi:AMP-binding protein [Blautia marasmi]
MPVKQLRIWQAALPCAEFINLYGPTEITCNCTYYRVKEMLPDGEKIPIGRAFPGRIVFLMDECGKEIASPGKIGEICVSGESLSEGYYHNPEETKERFISCSKNGDGSGRYYKTGDLGFYGKCGELYFSGRKDFQIKHMGHRIELEEIEHAMEQIGGLERGLCLLDEKRNKLVAFYLGDISKEQIQEMMKEKLPAYMIPHKLVKTDLMPLNKNGKTDREYFRQKLR